MVSSNVVPEIRFKGFSGAWEEKKLGEVVQITMGQSPNGENYTDDPTDHILVQGNADMKDGMVFPRLWTKQVTKTAQAGDIIFSVRAPVGDIGKTAFNIVIGRGVASLKGNEFVFQALHKLNMMGYWKKLSAGSTFDSINSSDLVSVQLSNPSLKEQTQIGNFFKNLDDQIRLKQRKLDKLVTLKKAMLEKLFPKEGEDEPEIRFKGFSGAWEEKKLGDVLDYLQPTPYLVTSTEYDDSYDIPVLTVGKTFILGYSNEKEGVFSKELPVIIFDDFTTDSRYVDFEFKAKSSAMKILVGKHDINVKFTYEAMQKIKYEVGGHGRHWISVFSQMLLYFPCIEEQTQIGNFFQKIDDLISLQKTELTKLKQIKSACLEKMFV